MRIAAFTDVHGNLAALDAVLADIARRGADLLVNLGDCVSGPLLPAETADRLMALAIPTVAGNHERQLLAPDPSVTGASDAFAHARLTPAHRAWIAALPATLRLDVEVLLCHGSPASDLEYLMETVTPAGARPATREEVAARLGDVDARLVLCGHTHHPRVVRLPDDCLVVNPGSVGLQAFRDELPWPHAIGAGTPHARYAMVERDARGGWRAEHVSVAYDWDAAAALAEANGSAAWGRWLRTGRA